MRIDRDLVFSFLLTGGLVSVASLSSAGPASTSSPNPQDAFAPVAFPDWNGPYIGANVGRGWGSQDCRVGSIVGGGGGHVGGGAAAGGGHVGGGGQVGGGGAAAGGGHVGGGVTGGGGSQAGGGHIGGGHIGGGSASIGSCRSDVSAGGTSAGGGDGGNGDGGLGGFQVGYNRQIDSFVFGIEGEFDWSDINGSGAVIDGTTLSTEVNWLSTLGGRIGYVLDQTLVYAKGGAAWGDVKYGINGVTMNGWFVGGGIEQMLGPNTSIKIEFDHIDLGSAAMTFTGVFGTTATLDIDQQIDVIKAGINYHY